MTVTTIKVDMATRDGLRALAAERGVTMDAALRQMLAKEDRRRRFEEARRSIEANPPDDAYRAELKAWDLDSWS